MGFDPNPVSLALKQAKTEWLNHMSCAGGVDPVAACAHLFPCIAVRNRPDVAPDAIAPAPELDRYQSYQAHYDRPLTFFFPSATTAGDLQMAEASYWHPTTPGGAATRSPAAKHWWRIRQPAGKLERRQFAGAVPEKARGVVSGVADSGQRLSVPLQFRFPPPNLALARQLSVH
jgi:hypothetical protein